MKITGTRSTITIDLENGFLIKAQGELLINKKFVVYKDSMTQWEPPHENLPITQREIENMLLDKYFKDRGQITIDSLIGNDKSEDEMIEEGYDLANKEIGYRMEKLK